MGSWYKGVDVIVFGTLISRERFLCEEKLKMPLGIKAVFLCLTAHNFLLHNGTSEVHQSNLKFIQLFF